MSIFRRIRLKQKRKYQRGQSMVEYLLVLFVIVAGIIIMMKSLKSNEFFYKNISEPLVKTITYNYKYGDSSAQGWDEGAPKKHIQISKPNNGGSFRLFQPRP